MHIKTSEVTKDFHIRTEGKVKPQTKEKLPCNCLKLTVERQSGMKETFSIGKICLLHL